MHERVVNERRRGFLAALSHRDYRLLFAGRAISSTGDWLYNVALLVFVFERTGSAAWVAATTVVKLAPVIPLGPIGGALADRYDRRRLMIVTDLGRGGLMVALTALVLLEGPVALALVIAGASTALTTPHIPALEALTPALVPEQDLPAANALNSTMDNVAVALGPFVGAVLIAIGSAPLPFAVNAATFLLSAGLVAAISTRPSRPDGEEAGAEGLVGRIRAGVGTIASSAELSVLVILSLTFTFVFGQELVLFPIVAETRLGIGSEGAGFLLAASGVGSVLAVALASRAAGARLSTRYLVVALAVSGLPVMVLAFVTSPAVAVALLLIEGAAVITADVISITTIQRVVPQERLGRVFGIMGSLLVTGIVTGSLVAPFTYRWLGLRGALIAAGSVLLAITLAALPRVRAIERTSDKRRAVEMERAPQLAAVELFGSLPAASLGSLAAAAKPLDVVAGEAVVREGGPGDRLYAIVEGTFDVFSTGEGQHGPQLVRTLGAGDHFGEIGLLTDSSRTATVRARTGGRVLAIDRTAFLEAASVTPSLSKTVMSTASTRLALTHPSRRLPSGPGG